MLDLDASRRRWSTYLVPVGGEDFASWWQRHHSRLSHLEPRIAEQWVHRHWGHSPFMFLDLDRLQWRLERWSGERIIRDVYARGIEMHADCDYKLFIERAVPTGRPFKATKSWDFPIVVLETPDGIHDFSGSQPEISPDRRASKTQMFERSSRQGPGSP